MHDYTVEKLHSVFGRSGFELDSITIPYFPSDYQDAEYAHLSSMMPLEEILSPVELESIAEKVDYSINKANRRLRKSIIPFFSKKNRFKLWTPVSNWALSVWSRLDREPRSGRYTLFTRAAVDTISSLIFLLDDTSWCIEEDIEKELRAMKNRLNGAVSNLYETTLEKVDIESYASSCARTVDNLPLSYVFDAVKTFADYPNSIPEKLNVC